MTKEKLNCFPHDKFNPHYAAHTQMVTDSNGDDDDNDDDWKHHFQLSGYLIEYHRSFLPTVRSKQCFIIFLLSSEYDFWIQDSHLIVLDKD